MDLQEKRLVIFAGKGGVGKTTCSAAAALHLAKQGKRTLLVTVDPAKRLEDSLGVDVGFTETPIQPNLTAMMLDPESVMREHLERELPRGKIAEHPLFRYVTQSLPGLNELMAIGKLNDFRRENRYDVIVIDTAPTGHALSFLSAPKAIEEIMSDKSLIRWAIRGYTVWKKLSGAARGVQGLLKREKAEPAPELDLEQVFIDIESEANQIRSFLTDPEHAAFVVVTLPEKLPIEETIDLSDIVRDQLGMTVHSIVVNKMQPAALGPAAEAFQALLNDDALRQRVANVVDEAAAVEGLGAGLLEAARFSEVRREMNEAYRAELANRMPGVPLVSVPLQAEDVQGLKRLDPFRRLLFP